MIAYPDTSFLYAMYRLKDNSGCAAHHFAQLPEPLHVASPLLFEFRQSTRWQAFLHSHNASKGFDVLHVATALHLGASQFLTFDANQKKLAEAEGMRVPL